MPSIARSIQPGIVPEGHTHAYDNFCLPLLDGENEPMSRSLTILQSTTQAYEVVSMAIWCFLVVAGCIAWRVDPGMRWETALRQIPSSQAVGVMRISSFHRSWSAGWL